MLLYWVYTYIYIHPDVWLLLYWVVIYICIYIYMIYDYDIYIYICIHTYGGVHKTTDFTGGEPP